MKTKHKTIFSDSKNMKELSDESVDLLVTSPPYPMIEMWDDMFSQQNPEIREKLDNGSVSAAYELMHRLLDETWKEAYRVLKSGGFACINIGDATRTVNGNFALYTNHARILKYAQEIGFSSLPCVLWRKQTNAPNKFMGSGMLPAGAYVTLEHEYVLILRKGPKRVFKKEEDKSNRRGSALFWEERNLWFSDVWFDIKGTPQVLNNKDTRKRSAAYPFELVYRLINMYSAKGDMIVDPFLGMGTTTIAAMASGRNSVGYEIDSTLREINNSFQNAFLKTSQELIRQRFVNHIEFIHQRMESKGKLKHENIHYGFPVMTAQERELLINDPVRIEESDGNTVKVEYSTEPQQEFCKDWSEFFESTSNTNDSIEDLKKGSNSQPSLF